jgi:cell division protein FtsZ
MENNQDSILDGVRAPVLKVFGLGGGGGNAINRMIEHNLQGVEFIVANTDHQVLQSNLAPTKLQLGPSLTRGLGAGGNPDIGMQAAEESENEIREILDGADMVFLTAGMGGGTGTGAISVAAKVAKEMGAVVVAIVTTPFAFEANRRMIDAKKGIEKLRPFTDTLITIPNDRLLTLAEQNMPIAFSFQLADDVLRQAVQGIAELVTKPGIVNVDFAHIKKMMSIGGGSYMAIGHGSGENRSLDAIKQALSHPLLDEIDVKNASGIIANFSGSNISLHDINQALNHIHKEANHDLDVFWGFSNDSETDDTVEVILVVTGLNNQSNMGEKISFSAHVNFETNALVEPKLTDLNDDELTAMVSEIQKSNEQEIIPLNVEWMSKSEIPEKRPQSKTDRNNIDLPAFLRKREGYSVYE